MGDKLDSPEKISRPSIPILSYLDWKCKVRNFMTDNVYEGLQVCHFATIGVVKDIGVSTYAKLMKCSMNGPNAVTLF